MEEEEEEREFQGNSALLLLFLLFCALETKVLAPVFAFEYALPPPRFCRFLLNFKCFVRRLLKYFEARVAT